MFQKRIGDQSEPKTGSDKIPANKYRKICRTITMCFLALIRFEYSCLYPVHAPLRIKFNHERLFLSALIGKPTLRAKTSSLALYT